MKFGQRLKSLREEQQPKLYQKELAEKLGVSRQLITMWETDQRTPDADQLQQIASIFNCSTDYLLGKSNIRHIQEYEPTHKEVEEVIRQNSIMFNGAPLDEEDKEDVVKVIKLALGMKRRKQ